MIRFAFLVTTQRNLSSNPKITPQKLEQEHTLPEEGQILVYHTITQFIYLLLHLRPLLTERTCI